jgi:hypothetical protein
MCESHFKTVVLWEAFACIIILTIAGGSRQVVSESNNVVAKLYRRKVAYLHHKAIYMINQNTIYWSDWK